MRNTIRHALLHGTMPSCCWLCRGDHAHASCQPAEAAPAGGCVRAARAWAGSAQQSIRAGHPKVPPPLQLYCALLQGVVVCGAATKGGAHAGRGQACQAGSPGGQPLAALPAQPALELVCSSKGSKRRESRNVCLPAVHRKGRERDARWQSRLTTSSIWPHRSTAAAPPAGAAPAGSAAWPRALTRLRR